LISFDEEDGEDPAPVFKRGIKSLHETNGKGLSLQTAVSKEELENAQKRRLQMEQSKEQLKA
jgi:hypothetical protein